MMNLHGFCKNSAIAKAIEIVLANSTARTAATESHLIFIQSNGMMRIFPKQIRKENASNKNGTAKDVHFVN